MDPVPVLIRATRENYYEAGYLAANLDVAQAVAAGVIKNGKHHFEEYGAQENRMQWAIGGPSPPEGPRIHPLSAHSRTGIWGQLHHSFDYEPELPKPLLEPSASADGDISICARLIDAFSRAVAFEQEVTPT